MAMNKYDRMLHILNLLRSRRNLNAQRLAEECGVTERSIYRDIISLSESNVPIYYDNGYKLASDNFLPPLNFTLEEYHLLKLALQSSPLIKTGRYADTFRGLRAKIESCLSDRVRKERRLSPETTHIDIQTSDEQKRMTLFYTSIEQAISSNHRIILKYDSIKSGETERLVDPYFIIFRGRAFYFVGYCHLRKGLRTFRINRLIDIKATSETFLRQEGVDPVSYFEDSWEIYSGAPVEVVVIFKGGAAKVIKTATHHRNEKVEVLDGERVRYSVVTRGIEEIQRWILGFGEEAEVVAPAELKRDMGRIGRHLCECYRDSANN